MSINKRFLLISRSAPYGTSAAREMLDIALTCSVFEQSVTLLLMGDAVLQLIREQQPAEIAQKNLNALQASLAMYDIDQILVPQSALDAHGLSPDQLSIPIKLVDADRLPALIAEHDIVITV
ncbi:sulfurtransferase complex subunit TusC [Nitrincola sp. MINF-07-Sa-05]|uniref:sulfurtransferase complex subunit TusC n=1 Tax=Nitrincola salilacus TaxID=3400273 RepID=UPI003917FC48